MAHPNHPYVYSTISLGVGIIMVVFKFGQFPIVKSSLRTTFYCEVVDEHNETCRISSS